MRQLDRTCGLVFATHRRPDLLNVCRWKKQPKSSLDAAVNEEADLIKGRNETLSRFWLDDSVDSGDSDRKQKYWAERMQKNYSLVTLKKLKGTWSYAKRLNNLIRLQTKGQSYLNMLHPRWTHRHKSTR